MGTEMASREDMQIIMETAERKRNHVFTLRLPEAQQVDHRHLPLSESGPAQIELVSSAGGESTAELVASPADEVVRSLARPFDHRRPRSRERGAQARERRPPAGERRPGEGRTRPL